jgi:predicted nucleic acid-binding protein
VLAAGGLGQGELEAMALYKQLSADALLIDDRRARAVAEHNQIVCIGTLGFLLLAKHQGIIQRVLPYVEKLRASSLYYEDDLLEKVLLLAHE